MATRIRTLDFLPEIFKTNTNAQFLAATLDQLVAQPDIKRIQGYIGSKFGYGVNANDYYVTEPTKTRTDYQLEPGVVFLKENDSTAKDFISYPGIIDSLTLHGGLTADNNRLFNSQFYSWDSFTNLDPIINFNQYYWIPNGPERVVISSSITYENDNYIVQPNADYYLISSETSPIPSANPTLTLLRGGTYTFAVNQYTQFWIQGAPGVTGLSPTNNNVQTRDVYGVTNNGATTGTVTFTVPQQNALSSEYLPGDNTVDVVSTKSFAEINGAFVNEIGGIDGIFSLDGLTVMFYNTGVPAEIGYVDKFFDQTLYDENGGVAYNEATDYPGSDIFNNNYEGGFYTDVAATFYTISLLGTVDNPQIQLTVNSSIPSQQKITATNGIEWGSRNFYRSSFGAITLEPYNSAILNILYYQDGTVPNRVGIINLVDDNISSQINVLTDILGKTNYTAPNGVVFTNGLKVLFEGNIYPESFNNVEYYVEGVGTAIELIPVTTLVSPGLFSQSEYIPFDTTPYDVGNYDSNLYIPVEPDYITIARNSINRNPWARSNRWFHIDVINATATYNNTPALITEYTQLENKAKRPIIEFYPNLRLFNSGAVGKNPIDFIDTKTTDAFTEVAGQTIYYPDTAGYTTPNATIAPVTGSIVKTATITTALINQVTLSDTIGLTVNDTITFTGTSFGGISTDPTNSSNRYYILEIINATAVVISATKQGAPLTLTTASGTMVAAVYPYSTTITIPTADVFGLFQIGQYIADSTNVLPSVTFITAVNVIGDDTIITVSWDNQSIINATSVASVVSADTTLGNYALFDGSRVVFAVDSDSNVRNKIYISRYSTIDPESTPVITLTEAFDGLVLPDEQTAVYRGYNYKGKDFFFDGVSWFEGQQKTQLNQSPKFDIFDSNGISFGDRIVYVGTSFTGSTLFAYGIGSGTNDTVLGFPIRYSGVNDVGDISFDVTLNSDTFNYVNGTTSVNQNVNTGYVYNYTLSSTLVPIEVRQLGWQTAVSPSVQYQVFEFDYNPLTNITNTFLCDIAPIVATPTNWPLIQVYINNVYLPKDQWTFTVTDISTVINITNLPAIETAIQILILSDQVSPTAYFQTPINLNNNPLNQSITAANVGDIRGQYQSIFFNNPDTTGEVFGPNNYRDLGNLVPWGNRIIQNSAALVAPGIFLRNPDHNLFNSLLYNSRQYITFKTLLVDTVNNTDYSSILTPAQMLDDALDQINAPYVSSQSFFWSDMLPSKAPYIANTYSFANSLDISTYPLSQIYNFETANYNGVLVYLTRSGVQTQLLNNVDYTISTDGPSLTITLDLQANDQITINEYNQTYGSYVPNTPTKLGLYPATIPSVTLDTAYTPETYFIVGHDGSFNKLYGNYNPTTNTLDDFRDQVLLEYETRVYNNLKLSTTAPAGSYQGVIIPGFFRSTDYSYEEFLEIYSQLFLNWVGQNRIDYKTQFYNLTNQFSYNYRDSSNKLDNQIIEQGNFRGAYLFFYDTSTPNETPWEMLGLANQPTWWTSRYGAAPYTSDNLVLWGDLETGTVWNDGNPFIKPSFARPGLLQLIPVDSNGDLLSPLGSIVGNYDTNLFRRDWIVGDVGPAEFSYRRSSTWPFDLMNILAVTKPADFFNLAIDVDNYKYNIEFNQYLVDNRSHLVLSDIPIYGLGTPATSYVNWIVDYEKQFGVDATTNITTLLDNLDVRLVYRAAGFSDKNLLKFYVEKSSANSNNSSLLIPDESYDLLLYENQPFDQIVYSGVVIQISDNGYKVYGNSQTNAYFKTLTPRYKGDNKIITVEDLTVTVTTTFFDTTQTIPYGTEFYNAQQVAQFLISYGEYLQSQGLIYDEIENGIPIQWQQMISEFLYWAQIGWGAGSITTINPSANVISIDKESRIVQPLTVSQTNFLLNQDLYPISTNNLRIVRDGTAFSATTLNVGDAISYGQFNISNMENGIVFNNVTLFNDTIYNLITGLRQYRINVNGSLTANWNGYIDANGFILNQDNIIEWNSTIKYTAGSIVLYKNRYWSALKIIQPSVLFNELDWKETPYDQIQKGLLPNSQTRSYESTLYYNNNNANLEKDADLLSFSLIGYRPRDYLALVDLTDVTQVNVYQNLIKNKGTLNAVNAFKGANLPQGGIDYTVYQNWAIKSGSFGGILNNNFIEFRLNEPELTGNPSIVGLTSGVSIVGVQQEVPLYSIFNYGRPIVSTDILPTISDLQPSPLYPTAGYVNFNDVKMASYFYSGLPNAQNFAGTTVPINEFYVRDYVWLANYLSTWQVYTPASLGSVINAKNNLNNTVTITFSQAHTLIKYQPFAIVNFNSAIDNYYIVAAVVDPFNVIVNLTLNPQIKNINGQGVGFRLQSQRVATAPEIGNLPLLDNEFNKLKVWVDTNNDGSWAVYRKSLNYQYDKEVTNPGSMTFGSAVAYNSDLGYLISDSTAGEAYRYVYDGISDSYIQFQTITQTASFGSNISYINDLYVISQPTGTPTVYIYQHIATIEENDLVLYQTISAPVGVTTWGTSTALSGDQNWLYISDIDNNNVHVYRRSAITNFYEQIAILTAAGLSAGDNFGYSISTDYYGDTVVVGAPQQDFDINTQNYGYTYVFARTVQNFETQAASQAYIPVAFPLSWTPVTTTLTATATSAGTNRITVSDSTVLNVGEPVVFSGTLLSAGAIAQDTVYYVLAKPTTTTFTISTTIGGTVVPLVNDTGSMVVTAQLTPLFVTINGTTLADNYYSVTGSTLTVYSGATPTLNVGDILNVSGSNFVLAQTLTNEETPRVGVQFGLSTDTNRFANEILIGAPFELSAENYEGAVHRYTNGGERYGTIIGTSACNVTTPRTILLNGYQVLLPVGNATAVASAINFLQLTNIQASALADKLIISLINVDLGIAGNKLSLTVLDSATLGEVGILLYIQTQKVECPHLTGRTQFGTVVKFDKSNSGSFIASAPVGTRFSATTFDFTDDELDNDTVFDNNATQWVDTFINAGAVYMFDYLGIYNENINNPGQFVYAQSTNAQDLDYGSQPYYGSALDFNDNRVTIGTPNFNPTNSANDVFGQVVTYVSTASTPDWTVYRNSSPIVDINGIFNIQLFSASTNQTLVNLDYIDPLQGKLLGAVTENIDVVSNIDPASYNSTSATTGGLVWGADKLGSIWFDTSSTRFMNYHQNDVNYNSQYWGRVFPGSDVTVYSWIVSNTIPAQYTGPGTPYDTNSYTIRGVINSNGLITPVYYFWARNTNIVFSDIGKTLADSTLASYIAQPQQSGISYFAPLLPSVFGLYTCSEYINATDTVLHIGYSVSTNDSVAHNQYNLIRDGYADDFLSGVPGSGAAYQNHAAVGITQPIGLYNKMLDSMCGVDNAGGVVPDPLLPKAVQTGVLARPRQGFFFSRFGALKNYLQYANTVLAQFPILELRNPQFLFTTGTDFDTTKYWSTINWWAPGFSNNTKSAIQVPLYADLSTLSVAVGTIVTVAANGAGNSETYIYVGADVWVRIGLTNGTIEFSSNLWDYAAANLGFGGDFFDTIPYDEYPSTETRYIIRALNEEIYINELLINRNKSLILLFEYIQSETIESQNYLDWLNKTSFVDVSHTIRELLPLEVFRSDNQLFLEGYMNEVKPYHVVIKEFLFKYTRTDIFEGDITDFDLPAQYNSSIEQFITPELVYANPSGDNQFLPSDPIWQTAPYSQWFNNYGLTFSGQEGYEIATLTSYMSLNSISCFVDNVNGFPVAGNILLGGEAMSYSNRNLATNQLTGISRGINGTPTSVHIPGENVYIDLPGVLVTYSGRGYVNPPRVTAYIDTSIYPAPRVPAQFEPIMSLDIVIGVTVIDPGEGYAILPQIIIDPAFVVSVDPTQVNTLTNTIGITSPQLQTGDIVIYTVALGGTSITGLIPEQHYYVNLLEVNPSPVFALYPSYDEALKDHDRIALSSQGIGEQYFSVGALANGITSSVPIRENIIELKFDRTSYTSQVTDWVSSGFYGAFYAGLLNNSIRNSSSNVLLQSTNPPIEQIISSSSGVPFEIIDAENQQTLTWSSRTRDTIETYGPATSYPNAIRIDPNLGGASVEGDIGSTIGFYIGMPVQFVGSTTGTTLSGGTIYYVESLVQLPNPDTSVLEDTGFTICSEVDADGVPVPGTTVLQNTATIIAAGLALLVGQLTNLAVLTINYNSIRTSTSTTAVTNNITVELTSSGQAGTTNFYLGIPIYFTGTVFGGIIENQTYYVITIIDYQTFTMSLDSTATTFTVSATVASNNSITCESTYGLAVNDPIIFTGEVFGNIVAGTTYYVREIFSGNTSFSIASSINGSAVILTNDSGTCTLTSQSNAVKLTTATGNMTLNVGIPISPGQITGQEFTFYETSIPYSNVTGTNSNPVTGLISSSLATVNRLCLSASIPNLYNNLEFDIASDIGGLTVAGGPYIVNEFNVTTVNVTNTSSTDNWLTLPIATNPNLTDVLYVGMPITFSGTSLGGILIGIVYYVYTIDDTPPTDTGRFTISEYNNLSEVFDVTNDNGTMIGTGDNYLTISGGASLINSQQTAGISYASPALITVPITTGSAFPNGTAIKFGTYGTLPLPLNTLTTYYVIDQIGDTFNVAYSPTGTAINTLSVGTGIHRVIQNKVALTQQTISNPVFDVSYVLGGYRTSIIVPGSGFAVNNTITILGEDVGGTTPANNLILTITEVDTSGGLVSVISSGTPSGVVSNYYLKVLSENQVGVYSNPNLTVAVSGQNFLYTGIVTTAATDTTTGTNIITVTSSVEFNINDQVVFTGTVFGNIIAGQPYFILTTPTTTSVTISETISGSVFSLSTYAGAAMTMAKFGDFVFLPQPFFFSPSIVKYNKQLYQCIISNNDADFIFGKWQLLRSDNRRLNALDRIIGYYQPTVNMPGVDLTQLVSGITYPNSTYMGNAFAPADEYLLDTILTDRPFAQVGLDLTAIVWNGVAYIAASNTDTYSSINSSLDALDWSTKKLANQSLGITDLLYYTQGIFDPVTNYVMTTSNAATPILISYDGVSWSSVSVPSTLLNGIVDVGSGLIMCVGENIVSVRGSTRELDTWIETFAFTNGLTNVFNGVSNVATAGFTGVIAVGAGQQLVSGIATDYAIIYTLTSSSYPDWIQVPFTATNSGFNSIAANVNTIVAVGDDGVIYTSFNATTWFPQLSGVAVNLNNIIWDSYNDIFVVVGDNGTILTGTNDGITWTEQTSGVTSTLERVIWNNDSEQYVVVGFNNTILTSPDAITWTLSATFVPLPDVYTVQGEDFIAGYGPEELVPGVVADSIMMTVATRPGTNWDETVYQHVGYNVVSVEETPTSNTQVLYSFKDIVTIPAQLAVFVINYTNMSLPIGLSISLYNDIDYTVNWVNKTITLNSPITYTAPGTTDILRIDVYEVGNGDQLVKANTDTDPLRLNPVTGFQEIYPDAFYSRNINQGSGVIRPDTSSVYEIATSTDSNTNSITCNSIDNFVLNGPISFTGTVFGGVAEGITYYIKSIGIGSKRISISATFNLSTGVAGDTFLLTTATGIMDIVVAFGSGLVWSDPAIYHNGTLLVLGTYIPILQTQAGANSIITLSTGGLQVDAPVVFSDTMFGNVIIPQQVYYVKTIISGVEFTISETLGGSTLVLTNAVGGATLISNDFAIGVADNGITAAIIFASEYDTEVDYISYTLLGETLPFQYGYTIPQVELFTGDSIVDTFTFTNYVGGNNPTNAIVEINGIRLTTDYTIDSTTNTIVFTSPPTAGDVIAVTTYNQTERQYLNTQYDITGSIVTNIALVSNSMVDPVTITVTGTTNIGNYVICSSTSGVIAGQNVIFKATVYTADSFDTTSGSNYYQIVSLGTTTNAQWNTIAGTSGVTYVVGSTFTATTAGTGTGTALLANVGGINTTGEVYLVKTVYSLTQFTISDQASPSVEIPLTLSAGYIIEAFVGGLTTTRITTVTPHDLVDNNLVRIDGVLGSIQLNDNVYYVHVINTTQIDLYTEPYNPALFATNYPVIGVSSYLSGGYIWLDGLFTIVDTIATSTTANGNRITVQDTSLLVSNTPIFFTTLGSTIGEDILGGILAKTEYYVYVVNPEISAGNFIVANEYQITVPGTTDFTTLGAASNTVGVIFTCNSSTQTGTGLATGLQEFTITETRFPNQAEVILTDAIGSINVTEFEQVNVDRLWVTVNGYRVPSSLLRINAFNDLSILTTIQTTDLITITSMMPTATPNEEVYLLNVTTSNEPTVFRANNQTRTWLTSPLSFTDTVIYLNDVTRVTDNVVQNVTCPAAVDGLYNIGLSSDKNQICQVIVYNVTTSITVNPANYSIIVVDTSPILQISSQVSVGDALVITSVEGRLVYVNGEQIAFGECNLATNTLSQLIRGANGTGIQNYTPLYTEVFGIIHNNAMTTELYNQTWNPIPGVYNTVEGDPLQIAYTPGAIFLRTDRN